jgi:predicted AlkP superfamily phosphohydrolase/phosphomutase
MTTKATRVLILGLDGADPRLIDRFVREGSCPQLGRLIRSGSWGELRSTVPPTSLPAWTSLLTGASPSSHGVPDFTSRRGYRVRFVGAGDRRLPTFLAHLERCGATAGAAWFPATYPPEGLRGWQISGWDSPVTARGDSSFVRPRALHRELGAAFGDDHLGFDTIDEFDDSDDWYRAAAEALPRRIARRTEMACWLLEHHPVDVAAFYFGEADTAAHHFWAFHDRSSPRRPARVDPRLEGALEAVYRSLDEAVGRLLEAVGDDCAAIVLSDHGSAGASDVAIHLNRALEAAGLLAFEPRRSAFDPLALRGRIPALIPSRLRRSLFRLAGGLLPSAIESHLRFFGIDWSRTAAFSEELTYAPAIWFNQLGREPLGTLRHRDRDRAASAVERTFADLRDPDGRGLVRRVIPREEIHRGPFAHLFPDLVVELEEHDGYAPVCLPSRGRSGPIVTRLTGADLLGRKGRSLPGRHSRDGILIARGDRVPRGGRIDGARVEDVASVISALAGAPEASWFEGRIPRGLTRLAMARPAEMDDGLAPTSNRAYDRSEERVVAERLRKLGYLDW